MERLTGNGTFSLSFIASRSSRICFATLTTRCSGKMTAKNSSPPLLPQKPFALSTAPFMAVETILISLSPQSCPKWSLVYFKSLISIKITAYPVACWLSRRSIFLCRNWRFPSPLRLSVKASTLKCSSSISFCITMISLKEKAVINTKIITKIRTFE